MAIYSDDTSIELLGTILHEATHNLGPSHEYEVGGEVDTAIFGGPLAATMEELKAQTGTLWYTEFLRTRGLITDEVAQQTYVDAMVWGMGQISKGMTTPGGHSRPYARLAAITLGFMMEQGAVRFEPETLTADGNHKGAFVVDLARFPDASQALMVLVGGVKARGDRAAAEALIGNYVEGDAVPIALIVERLADFTRGSLVYSVTGGN